jgi:hypothetical protein
MAAESLLSTLNKKKLDNANKMAAPRVTAAEPVLNNNNKAKWGNTTQDKVAATPLLKSAAFSGTKTSTADMVEKSKKYAGNPLTAPTAPVKPEAPLMTAEQLAKQDRLDQTARVEGQMQEQNELNKSMGLATGPETLQEVVDQFKAKQEKEKTYTQKELERLRVLDEAQAARFNEQAKGAIAASDVSFAQGREGAVAGSAGALKNEFSAEMNKRIGENKIRLESAQDKRDNLMLQLEEAQKTGQLELAETISKNLSYAKQQIEQEKTAYLQTLNEMNEQARLAEQSTRQSLTTYTGLVDSGATMTPKGISNMAVMLGIPFDVAFDYYQGAEDIRKEKGLSLEEQQIKLDDLKFGFDEKVAGIRGEQAQAVSDFSKLAKSGNYTPDQLATFATAMNIPNAQNPLYLAKVKLETAQATMEEFKAKYQGQIPPEGSLERLQYDKAALELKIAQAENSDYNWEVPDEVIKDVFYQPGKGDYGNGEGKRQCGEAYNDITDGPKVGDSYASKMAIVTKQDNPMVGNALVIPIGSAATGHIETVIESNPISGTFKTVSWNRDGKGSQTIQTYSVDELKNKYGSNWGFSDSKLKEKYSSKLSEVNTISTNSGGLYAEFLKKAKDEGGLTGKDATDWAKKMTEAALEGGPEVEKKELPATQVVMLEDAKFLPDTLGDLQKMIESGQGTFDPLLGPIDTVNPFAWYDSDKQVMAAKLRTTAQLVGKYMEGGVLRKEDEVKYAEMLPKNTDTREVALGKLNQVKEMLQQKTIGYIDGFDKSNYNVENYKSELNELSGGALQRKESQAKQAEQIKGFLDFGKSLVLDNYSETNQFIVPEEDIVTNSIF